MSEKQHIFIVEDEPKIANVLSEFLMAEGYTTTIMLDGINVVQAVKSQAADFMILDIMLPNKDGLTICKEVRVFSDLPILMLTARVDEVDRLMGLGFGADDYVCKPFSSREVVARVHAILRRSNKSAITEALVKYKSISLDVERHLCTVKELKVELTPVEFRLLHTLLLKPSVVHSREKLMHKCYEDARIVSNRTIDSHLKNLRNKLSQVSPEESLLQSIYGVGYKIE